MNCSKFEKMIPAFLNDALEYKELKQFLKHMESCPECKEELTIQVLVSEGMARLEEGSAFDLQKELSYRIEEAGKRIRLHRMLIFINITLLATALLAIAVTLLFFAG
ncbi:MAG: zf-HC2 domain-containing protein [Lachnospiraceae bacterium]|nr:zf-HC2 domain-containing protein [Lachnospiraceae bacterium]